MTRISGYPMAFAIVVGVGVQRSWHSPTAAILVGICVALVVALVAHRSRAEDRRNGL